MPDDLRQVYDRLADTSEQNRGLFDMSEVIDDFYRRLPEQPGRLLDLGCGAGEPFPAFFLARGWRVVGVDFSFRMLELARHPDIQDRCIEEMEAGGTEYLDAVIKEVLRLHPVVPMVMRELQEPATVDGRTYPAGVTVSPSIVLAHRSSDAYPSPRDFVPQRFLGDVPTPTTWLPFGGGARRCIGASFAMMEGQVILQQVLRRYRIEPVGSGREWPRARNVTLYPWKRARVTLRGR